MPRLKQTQKDYRESLKAERWKILRAKAIFRDGAQCRHCGGRHKLEVHHLTYARRGHERLGDLITLCNVCHDTAHGRKQKSPKRGVNTLGAGLTTTQQRG